MTSFHDFALPAAVRQKLTDQGITSPFPIQVATLPDTLAGKDVLGRGQTGSGKTLAFALPMVTRLAASSTKRPVRRPRALVLCPTRELANQINATVEPLARALGLVTTVIFGGVAQGRQVSALNGGVDIVIACPGRLEDLLKQKVLTLDCIEITVLDEADHMADLGFLPGVKRIMAKTPRRGQRMLFSATLDNGVDELVERYLDRPAVHSVDSAQSPVSAMTHHIFAVPDAATKYAVVSHLASGEGRRVLFTRTKHEAKNLAKALTAQGIPAVELQGNLAQNARERNLEAFSSGVVKVLVATDVAARGIHVDGIELVVHVDPPAEHKSYLHRSGRTARAGQGGDVVTIMLPEQHGEVRDLTRLAKISAKPQPVSAGDAVIKRLVGEVAAYVRPSGKTGSGQAARSARASGASGANAGSSTATAPAGAGSASGGARPARSGIASKSKRAGGQRRG
ncbi:Superfamily II DNA and RNA helicase [Sanguibacter gelidistatuariae]|uniref:Superfamily II DNA and RNA helicase n=1 Tax=Sanguibacter gelidistatuariae TaxID=1814289 RepID=A0A1G6K096_9MICO|nr:DEAD/DEAH box helicase [Sanguibacter gelidistatuariae]SDC24410.1 Superfamily II DNA and RNA helicase [Sanguibacter gelidistatuariae]